MIIKRAYAKINLGLEVISKREDGFHNLKMVMDSINLYDELTFSENDTIEVISNPKICDEKDNLVYKSAMLMKKMFNINKGVRISIKKNIPIEAGLAGGSSDAACTIRTLNEMWKINESIDKLLSISEMIGSDVSYCLIGGVALVEGKGEKITPLKKKTNFSYILIKPKYSCKTKDIFENFKKIKASNRFQDLIESIYNNDRINIAKNVFNDLTYRVDELVCKNKPSQIIKELLSFGCIGANMTGSGSCVFGICLNDDELEIVKQNMSEEFIRAQDSIYFVKHE